jgi:hypothetical protein
MLSSPIAFARGAATCAATLVLLCAASTSGRADQWAPNLTLTATWQDNASNANRASDKISALQTLADLVASERYSLTSADSAHLTLHAAGEWWPRFNSLFTAAAGGRLEWQHKFGLGALAPVFSCELAGDFVTARESGRAGTSGGVTLGVRKRFNDRWRVTLTEELSELYARAAVFDRSGAQTTLEVACDLTPASRLTLATFYRNGDVLSYATPPRPDIVPIAPNRMPVTTFERGFVAYSIRAETVGVRFAYIHALTEESAVVASYECRRTERAPLQYVNQLVSLALVRQF